METTPYYNQTKARVELVEFVLCVCLYSFFLPTCLRFDYWIIPMNFLHSFHTIISRDTDNHLRHIHLCLCMERELNNSSCRKRGFRALRLTRFPSQVFASESWARHYPYFHLNHFVNSCLSPSYVTETPEQIHYTDEEVHLMGGITTGSKNDKLMFVLVVFLPKTNTKPD